MYVYVCVCVWVCVCGCVRAVQYHSSSRAVAASETPSAARFRRSAEAPVIFM